MSNTLYDDVFRTLLNDCSALIMPVINEAFGENYAGDEEIVFAPNEHFLNREGGQEQERITDTSFKIIGLETKNIIGNARAVRMKVCWCVSSSMIPRLDEREIKGNVLTELYAERNF